MDVDVYKALSSLSSTSNQDIKTANSKQNQKK